MNRISAHFVKALHDYASFLKVNTVRIIVTVLALIGLVIVFWPYTVKIIPAGHMGVLYQRLGSVTDLNRVYTEGLNFILPWNQMNVYPTQVQQKYTEIEILTSDRLKSKMTISFQYVLYSYNLPLLHKYVGPDYYDKVILPMIEASAREAVARYTSLDAFTKDIKKISERITFDTSSDILKNIAPSGLTDVRLITISDVQMTKFSFPTDVEQALQQKAVELVKSEQYEYRLVIERLEADRKRIEAEGIRDFQSTVSSALNENYLLFKGIEATAKLAESNNSKVLVFGTGSSGLPLIMGGSEVMKDAK